MARITIYPTDENFFADQGALIIPTRMEDGGENKGALAVIARTFPTVPSFIRNARALGFLKAGSSYVMVLPNGKNLILLGIAAGSQRNTSIRDALASVNNRIECFGLSEIAMFAPTREIANACRRASQRWPSFVTARIYQRSAHG